MLLLRCETQNKMVESTNTRSGVSEHLVTIGRIFVPFLARKSRAEITIFLTFNISPRDNMVV